MTIACLSSAEMLSERKLFKECWSNPVGGPLPSLKLTIRLSPVGVSDRTSQSDISATKSWGLWHFSTRPFQISGTVSVCWVEGEGLMGCVLAV